MFAVVPNPFTSSSKARKADKDAVENARNDRVTNEATIRAASEANKRQMQTNSNLAYTGGAGKKSTLADRAKYQFEADSEDDEMENQIEDNLDAISRTTKTLHQVGLAIGQELDSQNKHLERISGKTDKVDDQIALNRAKLDRIK